MSGQNRTYVLRIVNDTEKSVGEKVGGAGGVKRKNGGGSVGGKKDKGGLEAKKILKTFVGYNAIKSFATPVISHNVSMVQTKTGSREAQQRASFVYSMHIKGLSAVETMVGGAMVGGLVGAVAGLALSAMHTVMDFSLKRETLQEQRQLEDISRYTSAQRATVSGSRFQRG